MYVRTISRRNKNGSLVEYIQLAHNVRDAEKGYSKADVIYSFGRRDQLDLTAIKRLVKSFSRFLEPADALQALAVSGHQTPFKFTGSKPAGGAYLLRGLWNRLHLRNCFNHALKNRAFSAPIEEAIFAMVTNRALAPSSKLSIEEWVDKDVFLT